MSRTPLLPTPFFSTAEQTTMSRETNQSINGRTPLLIVIRYAWTDRHQAVQSIPCDRPSRTALIKSWKANSFCVSFGMWKHSMSEMCFFDTGFHGRVDLNPIKAFFAKLRLLQFPEVRRLYPVVVALLIRLNALSCICVDSTQNCAHGKFCLRMSKGGEGGIRVFFCAS